MSLTRLRHGRPARPAGDSGFTLVELVVTVAILGVVSAALFGVVLQYLRTTTDSRARLSESTDQQFISTYWQNDVSSLGRRSLASTTTTATQSVFEGAGYGGSCRVAGSTVVVVLAWSEFAVAASDPAAAWDTTSNEVAYVTVPSDGRLSLERVRCRGGVAQPPQTVAHHLTTAPTVACDVACSSTTPLPNRVSMTFTVQDADHPGSSGYTTTVSADRRQG